MRFKIFTSILFSGCGAVFAAASGVSLVEMSRSYSLLRCTGFSLWASLLQSTGSGTRALLLRGMWDLPQPGVRAVSLALRGGFLTTGRKWKQGSPCFHFLDSVVWNTNNFNFDEVQFTRLLLLLLLVLLLSYLRRSCLIQGHRGLLLCFLLRVIVPVPSFRSLVHVEVNFLYSVMWGCNFTLLPLDI